MERSKAYLQEVFLALIPIEFTPGNADLIFRYASLYFIVAVDKDDNELITLETIHHYVEILDRYFGNVRWTTVYLWL